MPSPTSHDVRAARFASTRFREGYEPAEVDALLDRVAVSLDELAAGRVGPHTLGADDVLNARFAATKFRDGYDQDQVDDFLDTVILALREHHTRLRVARRAAGAAPPDESGGGWIRTAQRGLTPVRLAPGLSTTDVEDLLERAATELDRRERGSTPRMTGRDLRGATLTATWWRPGYARPLVDPLLDEIAAALGE